MNTKKQEEGWDLSAPQCDIDECNTVDLPEDNDFPLGEACDLSGEGSCESCQ